MFRRLTFRRTLKWTGTVVCVLLATVFIIPICMNSGLIVATHAIDCSIRDGVLTVSDVDTDAWTRSNYESQTPIAKYLKTRLELGWYNVEWWPTPLVQSASVGRLRWCVRLPLWIPLLVLLLPTLWLWRLDRPPLPNHCRKCNYNLTRNTSGRCPECGAANETGPGSSAALEPPPTSEPRV